MGGTEPGLRLEALQDLVRFLGPDGDQVETKTAGDSDMSAWVAAVSTAPFLTDRRALVVRQALRANPSDFPGGADTLARLPEWALMVLVADEEVARDDSQVRAHESRRKAWETLVKKAGGFVFAPSPDAKSYRQVLKARAQDAGVKISDRAIDSLLEMCGASLSRAMEELDKLVLYVGDAAEIREADVAAVVLPSREWNVYRMVDAVVAGNASEALGQLRILVGTATKAEDAAFSRIFPNLTKSFRLLWQARVILDAKATLEHVPAAVQACLPEKPNLLSEPDWRQRRTLQSARSLSLEQIAQCLKELSDADARMKGMLPAFDAMDSLEQMVLRMVAAVSGAR
ncbi:MAG: DNA polymerase III subunit delta [Fimbriimonadaceae bacterium]